MDLFKFIYGFLITMFCVFIVTVFFMAIHKHNYQTIETKQGTFIYCDCGFRYVIEENIIKVK